MAESSVKSAARSIAVLELFARLRAPMKLKQIWQHLDYPQSSTTSLLKSLVGMGYLNYDRISRSYFPTPRVAALGDWIGGRIFLGGRVLSLMHELRDETGETVVLVAQNDLSAQYLRALESAHDQRSHVVEGFMRALPHSSAGLTLLSRMSTDRVDRLCRHINMREPDRASRLDITGICRDVERVRHQGYCFLRAAASPDAATATISMAMPPEAHGVPLALSICGPEQRVTPRRGAIVGTLRRAIERLA